MVLGSWTGRSLIRRLPEERVGSLVELPVVASAVAPMVEGGK